MSNCDNELNSQIKALHARLDRVDNHLLAHTAQSVTDAIAMIAQNASVSLKARGVLKLAESSAYSALIKLADSLPGVATFKQLMQLDSAALVGGLSEALASMSSNIVSTAVTQLEGSIDAQILAAREHSIALIGAAGNELDETVAALLVTLNDATSVLNKANSAVSAIQAFINTLSNISACKVGTSVVRQI
jgi:hypothetical protein